MQNECSEEKTRLDILRAGLYSLGHYGYYGTSLAEIAEICGIKKAFVYRHFASKAELVSAVLDMVADELTTQLYDAPGKYDISDIISTHIEHNFRFIVYMRLFIVGDAPPSCVKQYFDKYAQSLLSVLSQLTHHKMPTSFIAYLLTSN